MNNRILQLSPQLANQIAAGEVIERPCSVVKELVENSIDAGATRIEVEIEGTGLTLIRVRDNGCGIAQEDLTLAFSRHATSKISRTEDLAEILSLGFRGEALASIASVANCRLISRTAQQEQAMELVLKPNLAPYMQPAAHPVGTTIEVVDLFFNTPVRRKFLRSDKTEFQFIDDMLKRLALSYPKISFRLKHQQRQLRYFSGVSQLVSEKSRIAKICGQPFIDKAVEIQFKTQGMRLDGWLGLPQLAHRQADCQYFFVNQRMVKDRMINHAIKTMYQTQADFVTGSYPSFVLYLTISPQEVDVNVHPTKQEVRFQQVRMVHDFITKCVESVLRQAPPVEEQLFTTSRADKTPSQALIVNTSMATTLKAPMASMAQVGQRYYLFEEAQGPVIIDLQTAKADLLAAYFATCEHIEQKNLLFPLSFPINSALLNDPTRSLQLFMRFGFSVRLQKNQQALLMQKPAIICDNEKELLQTLLGLMGQNIPEEKICQQIGHALPLDSLSKIPPVVLHQLIEKWLTIPQQMGCIRLSHEKFKSSTLAFT